MTLLKNIVIVMYEYLQKLSIEKGRWNNILE